MPIGPRGAGLLFLCLATSRASGINDSEAVFFLSMAQERVRYAGLCCLRTIGFEATATAIRASRVLCSNSQGGFVYSFWELREAADWIIIFVSTKQAEFLRFQALRKWV